MSGFTDPPIAVSSNPIAQKDAAETFAESDVTVITTGTTVANKSLEILSPVPVYDTTMGITFSSLTGTYGIVFDALKDTLGVEYRYASGNSGSITPRIEFESDGTTVATGSSVSPGESGTIEADLTAGVSYRLVGDFDSQDRASGGSPPQTDGTGSLTATGAYNDGSLGDSSFYVFDQFEAITATGTVTVEWPAPTDIFRWDAATFTRTPDGGTVTVNIEENDGTGWTEIATDISRGDSIDAAPDSAVRFRVDISRTDTSNNPTLDSIYRRYVL